LHVIDVAEKDGIIRFRTRSRNTTIYAHAQRKIVKNTRKCDSTDKISPSFSKLGLLGSLNWMIVPELWTEVQKQRFLRMRTTRWNCDQKPSEMLPNRSCFNPFT